MGKITGFKEFERKEAQSRPVKDRVKDYKDVHKELSEPDVQEQGARCMDCGTPFCSWGCPLGNVCPDWNDLAYKGKWKEAYERLAVTSNFSEFTGRICPALCEGSCCLGVNKDPVSIREIELKIVEKAFKEGWVKPNPPKVRTGKKVAVIGSGPSGLAAANELNQAGHLVTVFERAKEAGGLLRYGIPDFKLEKHIVTRRIKLMEGEGIIFRTGVNVGTDVSAQSLLDEFDAVVLTGGSTVPRDLKAEGRELKGIHFAMDFLGLQNRKVSNEVVYGEDISAKDKVVVVIGGGDTGSDCIGTAIRQGAKAVYQYEIMPKPPVERDETMPWPVFPRTLKTTTSHEEGCTREWCISTDKFEGNSEGNVETIYGARVNWESGADGKMNMVRVPGSEFQQHADLVLLALGFLHPEQGGMLKELGVEFDPRGNVKTSENYMTSKEGVFAAGDMRTGQSLVVRAIHDGRQVAKKVDEYLMGESSLRG